MEKISKGSGPKNFVGMVLAAALSVGLAAQASAKTWYINADTTKLFKAKSMSSEGGNILEPLKRGDALEELAVEGMFVKVKTSQAKEGYVSKLFVKESPPLEVVKLDNVNKVENARSRASAFQVAASARGLRAEDRRRSDQDKYVEDHEAVLEVLSFSEKIDGTSLNSFIKEGSL